MSETPTHGSEAQDFRFHDVIGRIADRIVVFSGKGGVGKTTVAVNLAYAIAASGHRVGLLDADITGPNVLQMAGITEPAHGTNDRIFPHDKGGVKIVSLASMLPPGAPVIWRGPMRSKVIEQFLTETDWGNLDTLVVDLPPGTGDEVLTTAQRIAPQSAIIVTTPQEVAWADARRAVGFAKQLGIPHIAILENMAGFVCPHCGETIDLFGAGAHAEEAERLGVTYLGAVPIDPQAPADGDLGRVIVVDRPSSPMAEVFRALAERALRMSST